MGLRFEWNEEKAHENRRKHGVSFEEAMTVFADPLSLTIPDPHHSSGEIRYLIVGLSSESRLLVVAHTDRDDAIRLNAREANPKERRQYEQG